MPRLITLLPCEKVIVDRDGIPSLIALFENIFIAPSAGQELTMVPKDTVTYKEWAVFSEWRVEDNETGGADQILELEYPDGTMAPLRGKFHFDLKTPGTHRGHQNILGFPVGQEGPYKLRVWLERDGNPISEVAVREMRVGHTLPQGIQRTEVFGRHHS